MIRINEEYNDLPGRMWYDYMTWYSVVKIDKNEPFYSYRREYKIADFETYNEAVNYMKKLVPDENYDYELKIEHYSQEDSWDKGVPDSVETFSYKDIIN